MPCKAFTALALSVCTGTVPPAPPPPVTYTLAVFSEDIFFSTPRLKMEDAAAFVTHDMTEEACTYAARFLNANGAFTACLPSS